MKDKVLALKEEYEKQLERHQKYLRESKLGSLSYFYESGVTNFLDMFVKDLEELLK